mgnify:CR=1 FL=1
MEIKVGNRKLLFPYVLSSFYWAKVDKREMPFISLPKGKSQHIVVCCNCGHAKEYEGRYYYGHGTEICPECANTHSWMTKRTFIGWGKNILYSNPKIITRDSEKSVSISLYQFKKRDHAWEDECIPRKFCDLTFSRTDGIKFHPLLATQKCTIQGIGWGMSEVDEPIMKRIIKAFESVYPSSGMCEVVLAEKRLQYGVSMKVLLNYFHYLRKYPYLEQLAKSGYGHILSDILRFSPAVIERKLKDLFVQANREKDILKLPSFVREFIKTDKTMNDKRIKVLMELCQNEPNMSRETFELFRKAFPHYLFVRYGLNRLRGEADYTLAEACKLVLNNRDKTYPREVLYMQSDYIRMCKQMGVDYERFPKHVIQVHNEMQAKYQIEENAIKTEAFSRRVAEYRDLRLEEKAYIIRTPGSMMEMIQEGQKMHHCVGSYADRFINGSSMIFFMRKASEPDNPYITMEFDRAGRLVQARKARNMPIDNKTESDLIQQFRTDVLLPSLKAA